MMPHGRRQRAESKNLKPTKNQRLQPRVRLRVNALIALILVLSGLAILVNFYVHSSMVQRREGTTKHEVYSRRTGISETQVLERIEKELRLSKQRCNPKSSHYLRKRKAEASLLSLIERHRASYNNMTTSQCQIPPASAALCAEIDSFAMIVVVSDASYRMRKLFINILKWLLDPSMAELWLVLPLDMDEQSLAKDPYGSRLFAWNKQAEHPVRLLFSNSLWNATQQIDSLSDQSVIVWMDGELEWRHPAKPIVSSWKEAPSVVFAPKTNRTKSVCSDTDTRFATDIHGLVHHRDLLCFLHHPVVSSVPNFRAAIPLWLSYVSTNAVDYYDLPGGVPSKEPSADDLNALLEFFAGIPADRPSFKRVTRCSEQ